MVIWIVGYIATALAFLGCDAVWLSQTGDRLYRPYIGAMMREDFALVPAIAFYLIYIFGIMALAVAPSLGSGRWTVALARGVLLGFVAYATYDLTNQATLREWSTVITLADLCWGTVVTGVGATVGFTVMRWLGAR